MSPRRHFAAIIDGLMWINLMYEGEMDRRCACVYVCLFYLFIFLFIRYVFENEIKINESCDSLSMMCFYI